MDIIGLRPVLEERARELAAHGYYVLVPNIFYRHGPAPVVELPEHITAELRPELFAKLLRVGMLSQDTAFKRSERTAREAYDAVLGAARAEAVPLDSLGLLDPWDADKPVATLSVGQRRRLNLALLVALTPQLLLDEPTSHLSPVLCDELEEAMGAGPGAIVIASHDRPTPHPLAGR